MMATGYTHRIEDGISFRDFVLDCSRAFFYPGDSLPKEEKPSNYQQAAFSIAKTALKKYQEMSLEKAELEVEKNYQKDIEYRKNSMKKDRELKAKYVAMLKQVNDWQPPTARHYKLKEFMIEQITGSIDFDCNHSYDKPIKKTAEGWLKSRIEQCETDVERQTKNWKEELERNSGNNDWVRKLYESLPKD